MKHKPRWIQTGGEKFISTVLQVIEKDELGRPKTFRLLRDDETVNLEGGEQFFVVYAPHGFRGENVS